MSFFADSWTDTRNEFRLSVSTSARSDLSAEERQETYDDDDHDEIRLMPAVFQNTINCG